MIENIIDIKDFRISFAAARVNAKLTQSEVSKMLKISNKTLIEIEKYRKDISVEMLNEMQKIYNVPDKDLFLIKKSN
ncbi:MAG: helix-turn-helix transcriptional regulator [Bacilli bacterium]|nr:helix-turn-helix transcriptional regulator [Bacilli bacterium]